MMRARTKTVAERFWPKVKKPDGCWLWTADVNPLGYGRFLLDGRVQPAHRVSWEMANGPVPSGLYVCHRCDNPPCVNPAHLFLGTPRENAMDMIAKGRASPPPQRYGEESHLAKLSTADVLEIRRLASLGTPLPDLAARFRCSRDHARRIVTFKTRRTG